MIRRIGGLVGLALISLVLTGCDPTASLWRMNETSGTLMADAEGDNPGTTTNVTFGTPSYDGSGFYRFNGVNAVARVPDAASLNPGTANFSFGAHVKFTAVPPPTTFDVIRKGVDGSQYFKLELFNSGTANGVRAKCFFSGSAGQGTVVLGANLNDNLWHKMTCKRTGNTLSFDIVTGGTTKTASKTATIGAISNTTPLSIGAKPAGGDWYNGIMDDATISVG